MLWLAAAAVLFIAWFCWQLFGSDPPIIVSKQTTYITEPLRSDGLPNYSKRMLSLLREGVTPENNAAVVMWQTLGLNCDYDQISADDWQLLDGELSLGPPPAPDQVLTVVHCQENRAAVLRWLSERTPNWPGAPIEDPAALAEINLTHDDLNVDSIIDGALESPWQRDDLPPLATWVDRNQHLLDVLVDASGRTRFSSPSPGMLRDQETPLVVVSTFAQISLSRAIARALRLRAMLNIGEGSPERAWQDLLAIHRWARLIAQGPFVIDQLVAIAIENNAFAAITTLLGSTSLSPELARQVLQDLSHLRPLSRVADVLDQGERLYLLDAITAGSRKGLGSFIAADLNSGENKPSAFQPLDRITVDWNASLTEANAWCDRIAAACRLPTYSERTRAFERLAAEFQNQETQSFRGTRWTLAPLSIEVRSDMLATKTIGCLMPTFAPSLNVQDAANTRQSLAQLAAALAVYRADHGDYPEALEDLVPDIIPTLPTDLYLAKPFIYKRDADGYLLYSTGENGFDDGGSNEQREILAGREIGWNDDPATEQLRQQIPAGADDLSIRVPRLPFNLPTPPASE